MKKILIVDDKKDIREFIQKRLSQENYEVMTAPTGEEAFIICKANHPDLVLLDIVMPQMDGYTTCNKIKQDPKTKDISIIFMTAKELTTEGIINRCRQLGACGYIFKPCTTKELLEKIKEILG